MQQQARQALMFTLVFGLGAVRAVAVMAPRCLREASASPPAGPVSPIAAESDRVRLPARLVQLDLLQSGRDADARQYAAGQLAFNLDLLAGMLAAGQLEQEVARRLCIEDLSAGRKPKPYQRVILEAESGIASHAFERLSRAFGQWKGAG